jgi:zinc protease
MFKRLFSLILVLATPLLADLPVDPAIRVGQLGNGITYYLRYHREVHAAEVDDVGASTNRAALRLVVPIGSVQEEEGEEGLAHWCEHLCFRGTKSFTEGDIHCFLKEIGAAIGPDANAYTSFDETVYEFEVPVDDPTHLVTAVTLMSEWASSARLFEADIEAERQIVLEERRLRLGAGTRVMEAAFDAILEGSKYAQRLPIGLLETLENATPETVRAFYEKWYPQVPVAFVAVGDFDVDAMEGLVVELFGQLGERMPREEIPVHPVPKHRGTRFCLVTDPEVGHAQAELLFKGAPPETLRDQLVAQLAILLFNNRFHSQEIHVDQFPITPSVIAYDIGSACNTDGAFEKITNLVLAVRQVQEWGFTKAEFERATRQLNGFLTLYERASVRRSSGELADECVEHFLTGEPLCHPALLAEMARTELATMSLDEMNRAVRTLDLHNNNLVLLILPEEAADGSMAEMMMRVAYAVALKNDPEPYVELEMPEQLMAALPQSGAHQAAGTALRFDNGLTLHLIPTNNNEGTIVFDGVALGGLSDFNSLQLPTARLVQPLLDACGIGPFSEEELSHLLADKILSFSRSYDTYTRSIYGASLTRDAETLFQLLHLAFTDQQTTKKQFEKVRARAIGAAQERQTDPESAFSDRVDAINHSEHPYFKPPTAEELQLADYLLADAMARTNFSNPAEFTFAIVGDFDLKTIQTLANTYLGSIPAKPGPRLTYTPLDDQFPEGTSAHTVYRGQEDRSIVQLTFPVSLNSPGPADFNLVRAASSIIGSRIEKLMRGALNATYNVRAYTRFIQPETSKGWLTVRFICDPQDAQLMSQMALRELRILAARGPTTDDVTHLIRNHRRHTTEDLCSNGFLSEEVMLHTLHGWDLAEMDHIPERIDILTKENVTHQLRDMLPMDNYTCVILLPEGLAENPPNG